MEAQASSYSQFDGYGNFELETDELDEILKDIDVITNDDKAKNLRFGPSVSSEDLNKRNLERIPKKTKSQNDWSMAVWREWAVFRNTKLETISDENFPIPVDISGTDIKTLDYWLCRFIIEVRRKDGSPYPPNTLYNIACGIQRYLGDTCNRQDLSFFKKDCKDFHQFRAAIDSRFVDKY